MTVRGILGTTDFFTSEGLTSEDLNDTLNNLATKVYSDNTHDTGTSATSVTTETDILTVTLSQNDLGDNVDLIINGAAKGFWDESPSITTIFKLYVGGVVKQTLSTVGGGAGIQGYSTECFNHIETGVDLTAGDVIVKITATGSGGTGRYFRRGLTVTAYNNV